MKKIAIITGYKSHIGGVETVNYILKSILENENYIVKIISAEEYIKKNNINIMQKILGKFIGLPYFTYLSFKNNEEKFDLVICNGEFSFGIKHKRSINFFHGTAFGYHRYLKKVINWKHKLSLIRYSYIQKIGSQNKYVITVSEFTKKLLITQGIKVNRVILNSVDTESFKPLNIEKKGDIVAIGSNAYKGYAKGFDIVEMIEKKGYKIKCLSNERPYNSANWEPFVNYKELPEVYNSYNILVFPSRFEACQMVPLEAMACGIPVVISKVGIGEKLQSTIPEFVSETDNDSEYIEKIELIKKNYSYYSGLARDYVLENFNYGTFKREWLSLIEELCGSEMENK
jgi:glycosyltransferase involved in cell wall biosynthesis